MAIALAVEGLVIPLLTSWTNGKGESVGGEFVTGLIPEVPIFFLFLCFLCEATRRLQAFHLSEVQGNRQETYNRNVVTKRNERTNFIFHLLWTWKSCKMKIYATLKNSGIDQCCVIFPVFDFPFFPCRQTISVCISWWFCVFCKRRSLLTILHTD